MPSPKPIIGIVGGIGSGKTYVSNLLKELGCLVIHSDDQVREAYQRDDVKGLLKSRWGDGVFKPDGSVNRQAVSGIVFARPEERVWLEHLLHPMVTHDRDEIMARHANDPGVRAFVWDTPLLFETGLNAHCDSIVFVDTPADVRAARVMSTRGWASSELARREILQWPLDKKLKMSDHALQYTADAEDFRGQVRAIFSRILEPTATESDLGM